MKVNINKKLIIIAILFIVCGLVFYKYSTDDVFVAQINDYNANKNFKDINDNHFAVNDKEAEEIILSNVEEKELANVMIPFGEEGMYGEMINKYSLEDFKMKNTEENQEKSNKLNTERLYFLNKLNEVLSKNTVITEKKSYIKDGVLYKDVKVKAFEEPKFRYVYYELAGRLFSYHRGDKEWKWDKSFWMTAYDGELFETKAAQNKAFELLIDNVDKFIVDEEHDFTLTYESINGKWIQTNWPSYAYARTGHLNEENNPKDMEEVYKMYDNRYDIAEKIFNDYIKNTTRENSLTLKTKIAYEEK